MTAPTSDPTATPLSRERTDLLETLAAHRGFLLQTASALCVGGLIKHVALTEAQWADFVVRGSAAQEMHGSMEDAYAAHAAGFRMEPGETLDAIRERYAEVAARTDELVRTVPDLDADHLLPEAPWFTPGATRSHRRTFMHIVAETAQHAGHADIIRETIDGAKTMG